MTSKSIIDRRTWHFLVSRLLPGSLLVGAAVLKFWPHLLRRQQTSAGDGGHLWAIVTGELFLGFWLLSGRAASVAVI